MFQKNLPLKPENSKQGEAKRRSRKLRPSVAIALALMGVGAFLLKPREPSTGGGVTAHAPAPAPVKTAEAKPPSPPAPPMPEPEALPVPRPQAQPPATKSEPKAYPSRSSLKAQSAAASTNSNSQELAMLVTIKNTTRNTVQAFLAEPPTAADDQGNAYTATSLYGAAIGGVYVCGNGSECLERDKAKTESAATEIEPEGVMTLTIAFCCKVTGTPLPSTASAGIVLHTREAPEGEAYGAWRTTSVGVPSAAVKAAKR